MCVLYGVAHVACGRKGPPLAPIVLLPGPVTQLTVKRVEGDVVVRFTVPSANTDSSTPADLDRVEVYAHTGPLPAPADYLKYGTLVQSIEVKRPVVVEPNSESNADPSGVPAPKIVPTPAADPVTEPLVEQGWTTTVRETLTEKHMEMGPVPPTRAIAPVVPTTPVETIETPGTVNFAQPVSRFYTVVAVGRSRNRRGPYAGPIRVPLVSPLEAPEKIETGYTATAISLSWPGQPEDVAPAAKVPPAATTTVADVAAVENPDQETSGTYEIYADIETPGTVDAPLAGAAPAPRAAPPPTPRFGYNVYDTGATGLPTEAPPGAKAGATGADTPLNSAMLTAPAFVDARVEFGVERCYVVRRVEMVGSTAIESAASPPACVTPVDTFAPAPPKALVSVASGTAVSLIWEANVEADLGGYLVLRGDAPGDKLAPLTPAPITDASYIDTSVGRNRAYVYEVVAVDKSGNQSGPSNRIEENIR